jgi:hypothetical protein
MTENCALPAPVNYKLQDPKTLDATVNWASNPKN